MRRPRSLLIASLLVMGSLLVPMAAGRPGAAVSPALAGGATVIDPVLLALMDTVDPDTPLNVLAVLSDQLDAASAGHGSRRERQRAVVAALRGHAEQTQQRLRVQLKRALRGGEVIAYQPLWIFNAIAVTATPAGIRSFADAPEIGRIEPEILIAATSAGGVASAPAEANIAQIRAPSVWSAGFRGQGVVVGGMDTGVDVTHPDLTAQWRGGSNSWYDPYGQHPTTPTDFDGHGTSTMGVIVGRDRGGTAIGVAPDAAWVAAKIFNDSGTASSTAIHLSFQWFMDPDHDALTADAPDIVNGSWTLGAPGCNTTFAPDMAALVAAVILPVFAAGNFGPATSTGAAPGNDPAAVSVGAVDVADDVADFSSRGPSACSSAPATFPSLVAPGVDIWSSGRFGLYGLSSGTSLAAPHVSGTAALLLSADPTLTLDALRTLLSSTALDLGPIGADDGYGAGRLDAYAAYLASTGGPVPTPTPSPTSSPSPTPSPAPDTTGPVTGVPAIAPGATNGSEPVAIAASIDDGTTGDAPVQAAEWFIDAVGAPGSGRQMSGGWGASMVVATGSIDIATLAGLDHGLHSVLVRGRDGAGNWGPVASAPLVVDRSAPSLSSLAIVPDPSQGSATALLTAAASDPLAGGVSSTIAAAEWFVGADPGVGHGSPLAATDGAYDGASEQLAVSLGLTGVSFGDRRVMVRARDAAGNWTLPASIAHLVTPSDGIFADGFESGGWGRWTTSTGASQLAVTASAARSGGFGLAVTVAGATPAYLTDASPTARTAYHARFTFDPGTTSTGGTGLDVFTADTSSGSVALRVQYRRSSKSGPEVRLGVMRAGGVTYTKWGSIAAGAHKLEVGWASTASSTATLWVDGNARTLTKLDTRGFTIERARMGPSAGLAAAMVGTLLFDGFVSSAGSTIGP